MVGRLLTGAVFAAWLQAAVADFLYLDFNNTRGLHFNGNAATSTCEVDSRNHPAYAYQPRHGDADAVSPSSNAFFEPGQDYVQEERFGTAQADEVEDIRKRAAAFSHRIQYGTRIAKQCPVRLRVTPATAGRRGSVWHIQPVRVLNGFETSFSFQVTEPSQSCVEVRDREFSTRHHRSCKVHGGDGLAFALHKHPNGSSALGRGGFELGMGGVGPALTVELDVWANIDLDDPLEDHVSVQVSDGSSTEEVSRRIGAQRVTSLADGGVHTVKVVYFPSVRTEFMDAFVANDELLPLLRDAGERRRVGTLLVYVDNMERPLLGMPLSLPTVFNGLSEGEVFAGFAASTGAEWAKFDVLGWYYCETVGCPQSEHGVSFDAARADYYEVSKLL